MNGISDVKSLNGGNYLSRCEGSLDHNFQIWGILLWLATNVILFGRFKFQLLFGYFTKYTANINGM
jgi:hypothetical protein